MKTKLSHRLLNLALLASLAATATGRAGVTMHGLATSTGDQITVELRADITDSPIISYTARVHYDPAILRVVQAHRNESVWYLSDGAQQVPYMEPDASQPGEVLFVGGRMDPQDALGGVLGTGVLLGRVIFSRLNSSIPEFGLGLGHEGSFASFVTTEGEVLEAQTGQLTLAGIQPHPEDKDLDSLSDEWEAKYFKDPELAYYDEDADRDGIDNQGEEKLGSDPTDGRSNLRLAIRREKGEMVLEWDSFEGRSYTVEAGREPNRFRPLATGLKATPPLNNLVVDASNEAQMTFYRILLESRE